MNVYSLVIDMLSKVFWVIYTYFYVGMGRFLEHMLSRESREILFKEPRRHFGHTRIKGYPNI